MEHLFYEHVDTQHREHLEYYDNYHVEDRQYVDDQVAGLHGYVDSSVGRVYDAQQAFFEEQRRYNERYMQMLQDLHKFWPYGTRGSQDPRDPPAPC